MFKKCNVVMLPTEKASLYLHGGKLYNNKTTMHIPDGKQIPQHLYITFDDEPKPGDWCIYLGNEVIKFDHNEIWDREKCQKIIATTDKSLRVYSPCIQCDGTGETTFSGTYNTQKKCDLCSQLEYPNTKRLPEPSQSFIKKYIEEYNKGNVIKKVLVEYEKQRIIPALGDGFEYNPKVNSKFNTITIKPIKDSLNIEKLENLLWKVRDFHLNSPTGLGGYSEDYCKLKLKNWIKENL